jgi:hypothetical protein
MNAISIEEAFAQGSTWAQVMSIATFHENSIKLKLKLAKESLKRIPDWKAKSVKRELDYEIARHRERVDYFKGIALRMKSIGEDWAQHAE